MHWVPVGLLDSDPGIRLKHHIHVDSKAAWEILDAESLAAGGRVWFRARRASQSTVAAGSKSTVAAANSGNTQLARGERALRRWVFALLPAL